MPKFVCFYRRFMKTHYWRISLFLVWGYIIAGCDIIDFPYKEATQNTNVFTCTDSSGFSTTRKVLIEDYTGFKCGNCPEAADVAKTILHEYPNKVVVIGVHAGAFAKPDNNHTTDFRTPVGTEWDNFFGVGAAGNPNGMVNRIKWNNEMIVPYTLWRAATEQYLANLPYIAGIQLCKQYNETENKLKVKVDVKYTIKRDTADFLGVYLIEDSVVAYQKDYRLINADVPDYVHEHVLRAALNSTWGRPVTNDASAEIGKIYTNTFEIAIDPAWRRNHLKVVAFLRNNSTQEIIQVERY